MFVGFRYYIDESEYSEGIREHFFFCFVLFLFLFLVHQLYNFINVVFICFVFISSPCQTPKLKVQAPLE